MPDSNNVYGRIVAPGGLAPVLGAVRGLPGLERAYVKKSQYDGAEVLRFSSDAVDFESTPLGGGPRHLLNGGVEGPPEDVVGFVRAMSDRLAEAGVEHHFEVYDTDGSLLTVIPVPASRHPSEQV